MGVGSPVPLHDIPFSKIAREIHAAETVGEEVSYEEVKDTPGIYKFSPKIGSAGLVITENGNEFYVRRKEFSEFNREEHAGELYLWETDLPAPSSWFEGGQLVQALQEAVSE